jgi:hypothetical protein
MKNKWKSVLNMCNFAKHYRKYFHSQITDGYATKATYAVSITKTCSVPPNIHTFSGQNTQNGANRTHTTHHHRGLTLVLYYVRLYQWAYRPVEYIQYMYISVQYSYISIQYIYLFTMALQRKRITATVFVNSSCRKDGSPATQTV